jgi:tetratricopeptide (TPR) repeat protein
MEFVSAKCPQCGGALQVPDDRDNVKCMYCGTDVLVREAINLVSGSANNFLALAKAAEEAGNHAEAYDYFTKILEVDPKNHDAWVGKANSAGWQSNLIQSRFDEMLTCYAKALGATDNDGMKEVIKIQASVSILLVAKAFFDMSTEHTIQFVGVPSAKFEHIDRCKEIIRACEKAYVYDPDLEEIPNFIVDICNRITRLTGLIANDKVFFESVKSRYANKVTSSQVASSAKSNSDCFVVTATMGNEQSDVVLLMRKFRDHVLQEFQFGRKFIGWYYRRGPIYASMISDSWIKRALSFLLIVLPCAILAGIYLIVVGKNFKSPR